MKRWVRQRWLREQERQRGQWSSAPAGRQLSRERQKARPGQEEQRRRWSKETERQAGIRRQRVVRRQSQELRQQVVRHQMVPGQMA
jgi:hypothetical protein